MKDEFYDPHALGNTCRRKLEYMLFESAKVNEFKLPYKDKYTLGELYGPVKGAINDIVIKSGQEKTYSKAFSMLEKTDSLANILSHNNLDAFEVSISDINSFVDAVLNLENVLICDECGSFLKFDSENNMIYCSKIKCSVKKKIFDELPEEQIDRLIKDYGINKDFAEKIVNNADTKRFERIMLEFNNEFSNLVAKTFENIITLKNKKKDVSVLTDEVITHIIMLCYNSVITEGVIIQLLNKLIESPDEDVELIIEKYNLAKPSKEEVEAVVDELIEEYAEDIKEGNMHMGKLIGECRKKFNNTADGNELSKIIGEKFKNL